MIPHPPGARSRLRAGNGLTTSKSLKSTKPASSHFHVASGSKRSVSICPTTSSITTCPGSTRPKNFSAPFAAQTPKAPMPITAAATITTSQWCAKGSRPMPATRPNPTADPAVPGASGKKPTPKQVAIQTTAPRRLSVTFSLAFLFFSDVSLEVVGQGIIINRAGNAVALRQPVVQINQLATLAAKRPVGIALGSGFFFTDGASHCQYPSPPESRVESESSAVRPPYRGLG